MDPISKIEKAKNYKSHNVRIVAPYPFTHHFRVKRTEAGQNLLALLHSRFPFRSREEWEKRIISGHVKLQDHTVSPFVILKENDRISHHNPSVHEPSVPDDVQIIDQNDDFVVVCKPAPMPVHPGGRYFKNTLTSILGEMGYEHLRIIHRLDAVTSGLILFGRNPEFTRAATEAFRNGEVQKKYFALVKGIPSEREITVDFPIRRKSGFIFEYTQKSGDLKPAETHFKVVKTFDTNSLVACFPVTGRTHQIRLHLKAWGHPIVDDIIYHEETVHSPALNQRHAIRLFNAKLQIPKLNVNYELPVPDSFF